MILDAYAVVAFLRGEPAAEEVETLLVGNPGASLTVVGVAEVLDRLVRLGNADEEIAVLDLAQLSLTEPEPLEASVAVAAGLLRARHYHRTQCAVSLADCIAAEVARATAAPVATSDPHLLDVCTTEGIAVEVLPDSQGRRWTPGE
ncbi:MAG: PIN domain-containing protein [Acidimicrobiales bacterium]